MDYLRSGSDIFPGSIVYLHEFTTTLDTDEKEVSLHPSFSAFVLAPV